MQAKIETIPIARHARVAPITEEPDEHSTTHDAAVPAMANVVAAAARKEPPTPRLDRQKTLGRLTKSLFGGGEGRARWSIMRAANKSSRSAALEAEDAARRAAAALIQKRFRDQTFLHRDVGPTVMCLKGGARALWGSINFGRARQSSFLACSDTTSAPLIAHIFQLHWSLPTPEMILSVTGGAQDFELTPRLQSLFTNGLTHVAGRSNVWIITGGTDSGVMKLVGNAMASVGHKNPIIGIAPYMATNGRDLLNGCHGDTVKYGGVRLRVACARCSIRIIRTSSWLPARSAPHLALRLTGVSSSPTFVRRAHACAPPRRAVPHDDDRRRERQRATP